MMRSISWTLLLSAALWASNTNVAYGGFNVWTPIGPDGGLILSLAVDPRTPATVYAGTINGGLFKTTDGGSSWTSVHVGLGDFAVNALAIDPSDPTILYAATDGGLFKSRTSGASWSIASSGLPQGAPVAALVIDPLTTTTLYAGVFLVGGGGGMFKSTNGATGRQASAARLPPPRGADQILPPCLAIGVHRGRRPRAHLP